MKKVSDGGAGRNGIPNSKVQLTGEGLIQGFHLETLRPEQPKGACNAITPFRFCGNSLSSCAAEAAHFSTVLSAKNDLPCNQMPRHPTLGVKGSKPRFPGTRTNGKPARRRKSPAQPRVSQNSQQANARKSAHGGDGGTKA